MNISRFQSKKELIQELGISKATFYRRLKQLNLTISRYLLTPNEADQIRNILLKNRIDNDVGKNETK